MWFFAGILETLWTEPIIIVCQLMTPIILVILRSQPAQHRGARFLWVITVLMTMALVVW